MRYFSLLGFLAIVSGSLSASSTDEWNKLQMNTRKSCLAKSELKNSKVIGGPIMFSHAVLYRVSGTWPQPHMKGKSAEIYCLHPFPQGEPEISQ